MKSGNLFKILYPKSWIGKLVLCLVVGAAAFFSFAGGDTSSQEESKDLDKIFTVTRGNFNVTLLLDGTLDAIKHYDIRCESRYHERIITKVVEDRSHVKAGELIFELGSEKHEERIDELKLSLDDAKKDLALAYEDLKIKKTTNFNDIKIAADDLRTKRKALQRYRELDAPREKRELQQAIDDAEVKVAEQKEALSELEEELRNARAHDEGNVASIEDKLNTAQKSCDSAKRALNTAQHNQKVFKQYDYPQKIRTLQENVEKAQLNQEKVLVNARSNVVQAERKISNLDTRIRKLQSDLDMQIEDMSKLEHKAPVDGIVSLGNRHRKHWQQPKEIKVGTTLRFREPVATIPDLSMFKVSVDLPEERRSRVSVGLVSKCQSPAIPGLIIEGHISEIPVMSVKTIGWDDNSPKVYKMEISTDAKDKRLMPGMTVSVEIILEEVKGVFFVPVEAVYNREGTTYCRVREQLSDVEVEVKTGRRSDNYVEITSGLKEGQEVMLFANAARDE